MGPSVPSWPKSIVSVHSLPRGGAVANGRRPPLFENGPDETPTGTIEEGDKQLTTAPQSTSMTVSRVAAEGSRRTSREKPSRRATACARGSESPSSAGRSDKKPHGCEVLVTDFGPADSSLTVWGNLNATMTLRTSSDPASDERTNDVRQVRTTTSPYYSVKSVTDLWSARKAFDPNRFVANASRADAEGCPQPIQKGCPAGSAYT